MHQDKTTMKKPLASINYHKHTQSKVKNKKQASGDVRIIGGQFKRRLVTFIDADGLRPTPDRLRETLFNWLLADIYGARVLDSCAGSGVLGFEALSRGAAHCTFIEMNDVQVIQLKHSAEQLKLVPDHHQIIAGAAEQILSQSQMFNQPFNIVFIDPPYAQDLWQPILTALIERQLIDTTSLIYLEADVDLSEQLAQLTVKLTQDKQIINFRGFECLKQTQVGQVVAGLYQLSSS